MTWRHPRKIPKANQAMDHLDLNEGFMPVVEEDGTLGEQNWNERLFSGLVRKDDLDSEVSMRVGHRESTVVDFGPGAPTTPPTIAGLVEIAPSGGWTVIDNYQTTTKGGAVYILCSMQYGRTSPITFAALAPNRFDIMHIQLSVRVDGAVYAIGVLGDQDNILEGEVMELGLWGWGGAADVDIVIPLQAGVHNFELVAKVDYRTITDDLGPSSPPESRNLKAQFVNYEIIVVEMW